MWFGARWWGPLRRIAVFAVCSWLVLVETQCSVLDTPYGSRWDNAAGWPMRGRDIALTERDGQWASVGSRSEVRAAGISGRFWVKAAAANYKPEEGRDFWGLDAAWDDEALTGHEASVTFGRGDDGRHYRLCFSVARQEMALWRTKGGWLAIAPASLRAKQWHDFQIGRADGRVCVWLDGTLVLNVEDPGSLPLRGKVGLGARHTAVQFSSVDWSGSAPAIPPPPPAPSFTHRVREGQDWFFFGDEPIARFDREAMQLFQAKTRLAVRPTFYVPLNWWRPGVAGQETYRLAGFSMLEEGARLSFRADSVGSALGDESSFTVTIGREPDNRGILYDFQVGLVLTKDDTPSTNVNTEWADVLPYGIISRTDIQPAAGAGAFVGEPRWYVWGAAGSGLYKTPINRVGHVGYYLRDPDIDFDPHVEPGDIVGTLDGTGNVVVKVLEASSPTYHYLCGWSHDIHVGYVAPAEPMPAGSRLSAHYTVGTVAPESAEDLTAKAILPPDARAGDTLFPAYTPGKDTFDVAADFNAPSDRQLWIRRRPVPPFDGPEFWDRREGHGDRNSIRIDGPYSVATFTGRDVFGVTQVLGNEEQRISVWVKTEGVRGNGPYIGVQPLSGKRMDVPLPLQGTAEWQQVSFATNGLRGNEYVTLYLGLDGCGTVWFDDLEVRPLGKADRPESCQDLTANVRIGLPAPLSGDLLLDLPLDDGAGRGALDRTGHGLSAALQGAVRWAADDTLGNCVEWTGRGELAVEPRAPIDLRSGFTCSLLVKPMDSQGMSCLLLGLGGVAVRIQGDSSPYTIVLGSPEGASTPVVPADRWSQVVVTGEKGRLRVWVDRKLAVEKAVPMAGLLYSDPDLLIGRLTPSSDASDTGTPSFRMARVRLFGWAMTPQEVAGLVGSEGGQASEAVSGP